MNRRSFLRLAGGGLVLLEASRWFPTGTRQDSRPRGFAGDFRELPRPLPRAGEKAGTTYLVRDELVLPEGFRHEILARWGDRFGDIEFGTNADYTGLLPVADRPGRRWLVVNHEYVSLLPWLQGFEQAKGRRLPRLALDEKGRQIIGGREGLPPSLDLEELAQKPDAAALLRDAREICREALADLGITILEVEIDDEAGLRVAGDGRHKRIHGFGALGIAAGAEPRFAGPGAARLGRPRGTMSNCSGGTSPWGTFLSCEENFQDYTTHEVRPDGGRTDRRRLFGTNGRHPGLGLPRLLEGIGQGAPGGPLDGRHYGWVAEIDPVSGRLVKQIALGRFRHENVALAVTKGKRLAAYMGDDARGGHVWKFVSRAAVGDPCDSDNSALLGDGTLHVARFDEKGGGRWLALEPETPLVVPAPERTAGGVLLLPRRSPTGDLAVGGHHLVGRGGLAVADWIAEVEAFAGRPFAEMTLGDLVRPEVAEGEDRRELERWVILMDAPAMANCIGGTPAARPEDLECETTATGELRVFVAFTDFGGDESGSPDRLIFPDAVGATSRRYGAIHVLLEHDGDPAATRFDWGRMAVSGEAGEEGGGFGAPDNLALDPDGELWMVTDMAAANAEVADRERTPPGSKDFQGIFGPNAMWWCRRDGDPVLFAQGPSECEVTGPTFYRSSAGATGLLLSVQHPGELNGRREDEGFVTRRYAILAPDGEVVMQERKIPIGSRFAARADGVPRAAVVVVRRVPAGRGRKVGGAR